MYEFTITDLELSLLFSHREGRHHLLLNVWELKILHNTSRLQTYQVTEIIASAMVDSLCASLEDHSLLF